MPSSFEYTPDANELLEKARRDQQEEAEANRVAIQALQRDLKGRRLQRATVAGGDLRFGSSIRFGPLVTLAVLILVERVILGSQGATNLSLSGAFVGVDVLALGTLLRHTLDRPSTR